MTALNEKEPDPTPIGYDHLPGPDPLDGSDRTKMLGHLEQLSDLRDDALRSQVLDDSIWPSPSEPLKVARRIAESRSLDGVALLRRFRGDWLTWIGGRWEPVEDAAVRKMIYSRLEAVVWLNGEGEQKPWAPTRHKVLNVVEALAAVTHLNERVDPPVWVPHYHGPDPKKLVVVNNGILSVSTRELIDHDPHLFNLVSVPFDYDPKASDPERWLTFLDELWPNDVESVMALQQFVGYILSGRIDLHKIMLLIGPTRAGKGVITRIMGALVGKGNVAGPTLASLGSNFGLQPLIGKPLAIISDARLGSGAGTSVIVERLLSVSGEDLLTIDRKYKERWSGKLNTRFVVVSNELPRFGDASGALAARFVVLSLRRSWLGRENTKLTDELLTELPGILNWALDGLDSLNAQGAFTEPQTSRDAITTLQDITSPVSAFVRDRCDVGPEHEITTDELWEAWKSWCEDNGKSRVGTKAMLGRDLFAAYPSIRKIRPRDGAERIHLYQGIQLVDLHSPDTVTTYDQNPVMAGHGDHALSPHIEGEA